MRRRDLRRVLLVPLAAAGVSIEPNVLGLQASVLGGDDRLLIRNWSRKTVFILGYHGEPFLRFARAGVFRNVGSPTTYSSRNRSNDIGVPAVADASSSPVWKRVASGTSFAWHDRRIRWTGDGLPPSVRNDPGREHHVLDWKVPGRSGRKRFAIIGFLGYAPAADTTTREPSGDWARVAALVGGVAALGALGALELLRRRR